MLTESEQVFENHCAISSINFEKLPEEGRTTPDYLISICQYKFFVEISQFEKNSKEKVISNQSRANPNTFSVYYPEDEERIRNKIDDKTKQLKSKPNSPMLLVLFDNRGILDTIDLESLKNALLGDVVLEIKKYINDGRIFLKETLLNGKGKQFQEKHKTYLSAVALLQESLEKSNLVVIHNPYAKPSLDANKCKDFFNEQYEVRLFGDRESRLLKISF